MRTDLTDRQVELLREMERYRKMGALPCDREMKEFARKIVDEDDVPRIRGKGMVIDVRDYSAVQGRLRKRDWWDRRDEMMAT